MPPQQDERLLSELTLDDAKRIIVYAAATLLALFLFLLLIGKVLVALLLGVVAGAYLLPVQEWLEQRLHARAGSALITISLIVVPLVALGAYGWYELSGYSNVVHERRDEIIASVSKALEQYVSVENTRAGLQTVFSQAVLRSGEAIQGVRKQAALLLASATIFFFTVFYVLTQRVRLASYIKVRVPGEFLPLYEKLTANVGGALSGALLAVLIDQALKALVVLILNLVFGVPLALVLALVTFLIGFFPLLGEWAIYIPISVYLLVFQNRPTAALVYLCIGMAMTVSSSLLLRPRLAARGAGRFNFYWMLVALVAGVFTFGIPGIVLGPAILGFAKAIVETLAGDVRYETSLLKEEKVQQAEEEAREDSEASAKASADAEEAGTDAEDARRDSDADDTHRGAHAAD
ncbi:MAG TPA: AI-2E family transporter [Pyrinomonadaceae bacterium]|nr:AI-2E family transporter [Pyrinomonadaceae bacterium]